MWAKKNVLGANHFAHMAGIVTDSRFPWFSMPYTGVNYRTVDFDQSFSHVLYSPEHRSEYFDIFYGTIWGIFNSVGIEPNEILRMRLGLITKTEHSHMHFPHVDFSFPHQTALFCLSGDSGVTTFFNEIDKGEHHEGKRDVNTLTVLGDIAPEPNQLVVFDGQRYHCASTPVTDSPRIILNINFL